MKSIFFPVRSWDRGKAALLLINIALFIIFYYLCLFSYMTLFIDELVPEDLFGSGPRIVFIILRLISMALTLTVTM